MSDKRRDERDAFWDLSTLVPSGKKRPTLESFIQPQPPVDYRVEQGAAPAAPPPDNRLHFEEKTSDVTTYSPADNPFISRVTVTRTTGRGSYYRQYLYDAQRLLALNPPSAPYVPFYSFAPQYSQLTPAQLAFYLGWRTSVRRGTFSAQGSESYLYLYAYELLNLGGVLIDAQEALHSLCDLWCAYAAQFPSVHPYFTDWVADFALVHGLSCPSDRLKPVLHRVFSCGTRFPEFYLGMLGGEPTSDHAPLLIALLSHYDWHTSMYAKGIHAAELEKHLPQSMIGIFQDLYRSGNLQWKPGSTECMNRAAFCGAVWGHDTRYNLQILYEPIRNMGEWMEPITAAVKYSENCLRARLGIRSRLSVRGLTESHRRILDAYYRVVLPKTVAPEAVPAKPAYEALYDAPEGKLDATQAASIERLSWENTKKLVPDEPPTEEASAQAAHPDGGVPVAPLCGIPMQQESDPKSALTYCLESDNIGQSSPLPESVSFLSAVAAGDATGGVGTIRADILADQINTEFCERIGDVVLERDDVGYRLIEDYREDVERWLSSKTEK